MRKSRFSESQILTILKEAEAGVPITELVRKHGISRNTYFNWKSRYGVGHGERAEAPAGVGDRERQAEADVHGPGARERCDQGVAAKKTVTPFAKRTAATRLVEEHRLAVARACGIVGFSRAAYYRPPRPAAERDAAVIARILQYVDQFPRIGFWLMYRRMRRSGSGWNFKRVLRVYRALGLNQPRRTKRRVPKRVRQPLDAPAQLNWVWSLDFMSDALYGGRKIRILNVLDEGNREGLACEAATVQRHPVFRTPPLGKRPF